MADEPSQVGSLYKEFYSPQVNTIKGEDSINLHPMANSALLRHLRRRSLGLESIIYSDCSLRDCAYIVVQDVEVSGTSLTPLWSATDLYNELY